jgi:hypothetical protein
MDERVHCYGKSVTAGNPIDLCNTHHLTLPLSGHRTHFAWGYGCLPLILVDGQIISRAAYPDRVALAGYVGVNFAAEPTEPAKTGRMLTVLPNESKCC